MGWGGGVGQVVPGGVFGTNITVNPAADCNVRVMVTFRVATALYQSVVAKNL